MKIPYGKSFLEISEKNAGIFMPKHEEQRSETNGKSIVEQAMARPIGSPGLEELSRGKKSCVIIISDHTRPVPSKEIIPPMLEALRRGNPAVEITLLVATGAHRASRDEELRVKLGDYIYENEKIVVHDCDNNNVCIGMLPSGAPLCLSIKKSCKRASKR